MLYSDLIAASMRMLGVLPAGSAPSTQEVSDGMALLNEMFESWGCEEDLAYGIGAFTGSTVSGTSSHLVATTGPAPIWVANPVPDKIEYAYCFPTGTLLQLPVDVITLPEWIEISRDRAAASVYPCKLYYDFGVGGTIGMVNLWPTPNAVIAVNLYYLLKLLNNYTSATTVALPRGYQHAARYNLALAWAGEFGATITDVVAAQAEASLKRIRVQNTNLRNAVKAIKGMSAQAQSEALKALSQQAQAA